MLAAARLKKGTAHMLDNSVRILLTCAGTISLTSKAKNT